LSRCVVTRVTSLQVKHRIAWAAEPAAVGVIAALPGALAGKLRRRAAIAAGAARRLALDYFTSAGRNAQKGDAIARR
jgi:hypothetical protein